MKFVWHEIDMLAVAHERAPTGQAVQLPLAALYCPEMHAIHIILVKKNEKEKAYKKHA